MTHRWTAIATMLLTLAAFGAAATAHAATAQDAAEEAAAQDVTAQDATAQDATAQDEASRPAAPPAAVEPAPGAAAPSETAGATPSRDTIAGGVVAAAEETAGKVREGGVGIARQGRALWSDVLLPMWQRLASAVPGVLKALVLLLAFWVLAIASGAAVRKLLGMTKLDDRAARDWGLGGMLETKEGKARSIEQLAGTAVKWLVLLFGFVAFFQALDLSMVAGSLQGIIDRVVAILPRLLQAAVILFAYWVLASLLRLGVSRGLASVGFDERAARFIPEREVEGTVLRPSGLIGRLTFYVVLVFGLPPFLDALGQSSLVAPLSQMLEKALGFLPNVVGAVVIFFLGHLIATVVREIVTSFLAATGVDSGAQKLGLGAAVEKLKLSDIAGSVSYFFIIVAVIGAAVEALQIRAVSEPVTRTLETLLAAVPLVFVAVVVVGVGYFLARIVRGIVESFLAGVGFDQLPAKLGLDFIKPGEGRSAPSAIVATAVMVVIILLTAQQALATLRLEALANLTGSFIAYLPQLLVGLVVILAALALSGYAAGLVQSAVGPEGYGHVLSLVARWAILVF
ncbi:MAG: mechanosensitive ion channel, partial [Acidobacteriota bacterium]|nr:mechanosensitive ion channel [Acidobacteriota bacterium]